MKSSVLIIFCFIFSYPKLFALKNNEDTLKGYFICYTYKSKILDYVEKYETIIPLNLSSRKLATDSFNNIISSNSNLLSFLKLGKKILKVLDSPDVEYLMNSSN